MLTERSSPRDRARPGPSVVAGDTIRLLQATVSTEVAAPDGGVKFRQGLVVLVDDEMFDAVTARRWVNRRIAEVFPGGTPGDVVTDEERTADTRDLDEQIARLQHLRDRAASLAADRLAAPPEPWTDPNAPIGPGSYRDGPAVRPFADLGLADAQLEALASAGFTSQAIVDNATDDEILEVRGVGQGTLRRLRGLAE